MTRRQHWTFVLAHLLYLIFLAVVFYYAIPEAVTYLLGGQP